MQWGLVLWLLLSALVSGLVCPLIEYHVTFLGSRDSAQQVCPLKAIMKLCYHMK